MLRSLKTMQGYGIRATDGDMGKVRDFLFEEDTWIVRYLVDDTGKWLPGRKVLIPMTNISKPDWRNERFEVPSTQDEIKNGPGLGTNEPVSRKMEEDLFAHHQWIPYWAPHGMAQPHAAPIAAQELTTEVEDVERGHPPVRKGSTAGAANLHSFNDVLSYHITHNREQLGRMNDLIVDDESWEIESIIFDTLTLLRGKHIQLDVDRVKGIFPEEGKVTVDMTREETETCPSFNLTKMISDQLDPEEPAMRPGDVSTPGTSR